jgi:alkyl hydroperoxide reductase subunit AhpC
MIFNQLLWIFLQVASAVQIQNPAPFFQGTAVMNQEFREISLNDFKGKYLVLFFYPLDWTFVCPTEIIAFSDKQKEFNKLNAEIVGVSVDSKYSHYHWINTPRKMGGLGKLDIPLLADVTKEIAKAYGVLIEEGDDAGLAARGTFIIDPEQNVRIAHVNDLPIGRNVDEIQRLLEAIQYHEAHGEVCPANWNKGDLTMTPDPEKSLKYFEKKSEL